MTLLSFCFLILNYGGDDKIRNLVDVYLLKIPKSLEDDKLNYYKKFLNEEEKTTFLKYKVEFKRIEFLLGRLILKKIISEKLKIGYFDICLEKNPFGKLYIRNSDLLFNLSHSKSYIACAFTNRVDVGIDIEYMNGSSIKASKTFFSSSEIDSLERESIKTKKIEQFYLLWTRKEGFLKAVGQGFHLNPSTISVPLKQNECFRNGYIFKSFSPKKDYLISIVTKETEHKIKINYRLIEYSLDDILASF